VFRDLDHFLWCGPRCVEIHQYNILGPVLEYIKMAYLKKTAPGVFPEPLVISSDLSHRQTFLILHGRGSTAEKFGPPLLELVTSKTKETLQRAFPHAKIIFLTASRSRATIYGRSYTHQWFDNWHLEHRTKSQHLQVEGLAASTTYVHKILKNEIAIIGKENVVLWGLSQGCATSLASLLSWDGEPFGAVVGMCGWLPFANLIKDTNAITSSKYPTSQAADKNDDNGDADSESDDDAESTDGESSENGSDHDTDNNYFSRLEKLDDNSEDPFSFSGDEAEYDPFSPSRDDQNSELSNKDTPPDFPARAIQDFRDAIDQKTTGMAYQRIPIFLGHGAEDERVTIEMGQEAKACLQSVGADISMLEYEALGHWYSPEMMDDIFSFLREKLHILEP